MTDLQIQTLILGELRELRSSFNQHAKDTGERLATLESQNEAILGNGQPGRLTLLEQSVVELQHWKWRIVGIGLGVSTVISTLITAIGLKNK